MSLVGVEMLFFLPVVFLVHWILPRHAGFQNAWLLLVSLVFYASWGPKFLPFFLASAAVDYLVGLRLGTEENERRRRMLLAASLAWNLATLGFFKYAGFFAESANAALHAIGLPSSLPVLRIALPLALSYVTLQKLAYVIDVYYRRIPPCRSALTFGTFVAFFPQLIAGPIPRARQLLPQYEVPRRLGPELAARGASVFFLGYAISQIPAGMLIGKVGTRGIVSAAVLLFSVVTFLMGFTTTAIALILLRLLLSILEGPTPVGMTSTINRWFPTKEKGIATGVYIASTQVAPLAVPMIAVAIAEAAGWRAVRPNRCLPFGGRKTRLRS